MGDLAQKVVKDAEFAVLDLGRREGQILSGVDAIEPGLVVKYMEPSGLFEVIRALLVKLLNALNFDPICLNSEGR